jgi:ATP-binding cassette subfamily F protein 3
MEKLAQQIAALDAQLADAALYAESQKKKLLEVTAQRAQLGRENDAAEAGWLEASEALEQAEG